jgi:hypothetical protein
LNLSNSSTLLPSNYYPTSNFIGKFPSLGRPSTGFSNDSKIKKSITVAVDAHGHPSILKRKRGRPPKIPRKSSEEKEDGG